MRRLTPPGRSRTAIATALLLGVAMAACAADPAPQAVDLEVLMADDWADTPQVLDVVRRFEAAHPGVSVELVPRPFGQIPEEAAEAAAAGTPFDLVHAHAFAGGATGLAEPVDRFWEDGTFDPSAYFEGAVEDVRWGSTWYGFPLDVNALLQIVQADVAPADDVDDVGRIARSAAARGDRGLTVTGNGWEAYGWVRAHGGEVVSVADDGTPTFTLDAPAVVAAFDFLGGLVDDGLAYGPVGRSVSRDAFELFGAGDTHLLASGTWSLAALAASYPDRANVVATMPDGSGRGAGGSALGGSSLYVGRGTSHVDLAVAFVLALTADDVALELAVEEGRFPPKASLYTALGDAPGADALADQLDSATPLRLIAWPAAERAFDQALADVLTGRQDAAEALADAQAVALAAVPGAVDGT